ncbi:amidase [Sphaerisporangium corydalis]|uniref:Amidase n=1 Tax=Sphaerisporangium corydalis TaxID=1441875 RepID=A0ABV9ENA2_9ACTN|nr:amidase [Sphaerisporangium corydalis]
MTGARPRGFFAGRTITGLARDLDAGVLSAAELVEHALDAIVALDQALNAFVTVDAGGARLAARRADAERAAGTHRGPLHGIPVAVKDIIDTAGLATRMGSAHFADHVPAQDATCVRRLREAGAIIVGKTTTHEFAYGPTGDRSHNGPSRNPHDPARMTGGSSGGSAAAVAAGMVPLAVGTDTGGSVRIPAALCGVVGFKPAFGAVPVDGVFPLASSLDHVGVLAGTAEDCALAFHVLSGRPQGPAAAEADDEGDAGAPRVGWLASDAATLADPMVSGLVRAAFPGSDEIPFSGVSELFGTYAAIQGSEAYAVHADRVARAPELFDPEVLRRLRHASAVPGWRYVRALEARASFRRHAAGLLGRYDLLALPSVAVAAPPIDARDLDLGGVQVKVRDVLLALTSPWNLAGLPALSVPAGTVGGLPVGAQLVCAPGRERTLFAYADRLRARLG